MQINKYKVHNKSDQVWSKYTILLDMLGFYWILNEIHCTVNASLLGTVQHDGTWTKTNDSSRDGESKSSKKIPPTPRRSAVIVQKKSKLNMAVPFPCSAARKKRIEAHILLSSHGSLCFTAVCDDEIVIAPFLELGVCFRPGGFLERRVKMAAVLHEKKDLDQNWPRKFHFFNFLFIWTLNLMKKWRKGGVVFF